MENSKSTTREQIEILANDRYVVKKKDTIKFSKLFLAMSQLEEMGLGVLDCEKTSDGLYFIFTKNK